MKKSNREEYEKLNEGFGYNPASYSAGLGAFSGKIIVDPNRADKEPAQYGPNTHAKPPHPAEELMRTMNSVEDKVDMRDQCPNCAKFREDCGCKGNCGNCGGTNGECDCALNQDFGIGDTIRVINPDCDCNGSTGRVVDVPSPSSVTYVVVKPSGGRTIGELVNKPIRELTIDEKYRV